MTKAEAAEKVAKLRQLAESKANAHEADTAKQRADELIKKYGLTENDLSLGSKAAAFDDLIGELDAFVRRHEVPAAVFEAIDLVRRETTKENKADALGKIVKVVRTASMFFGFDKTVKGVKDTVDGVLTKHKVTI